MDDSRDREEAMAKIKSRFDLFAQWVRESKDPVGVEHNELRLHS